MIIVTGGAGFIGSALVSLTISGKLGNGRTSELFVSLITLKKTNSENS